MDELERQRRQREFTIILVLFILLVIVGKITLNGQQGGSTYYGSYYNHPYGTGIYNGNYYNDPYYGRMPYNTPYGPNPGQWGYGHPEIHYAIGPPMATPVMNHGYVNYNPHYRYQEPNFHGQHFGGNPYYSSHYNGYGMPNPNTFYGPHPYSMNPYMNQGFNHMGGNPINQWGQPNYGWGRNPYYPQTAPPNPYNYPAQERMYMNHGWNGYYAEPHYPHQYEAWNYGYQMPGNQMGPNFW